MKNEEFRKPAQFIGGICWDDSASMQFCKDFKVIVTAESFLTKFSRFRSLWNLRSCSNVGVYLQLMRTSGVVLVRVYYVQ